jgi:hypothetical protein
MDGCLQPRIVDGIAVAQSLILALLSFRLNSEYRLLLYRAGVAAAPCFLMAWLKAKARKFPKGCCGLALSLRLWEKGEKQGIKRECAASGAILSRT